MARFWRQSCGFLLGIAVLALSAPIALAQWSADAAANLPIADKPNEQNISHIGMTSDGGCYIAWFDNAAGGHDVYLQRLNAAGSGRTTAS